MQPRIMFIEPGGGLAGVGSRIGLVSFSKTGKTIRYGDKEFQSIKGGYKSNYFEINTGEHYWISGPRKDGNDALYPMTIEIDDDIREEYWCVIRNQPELTNKTSYFSQGKYSRRKPYPELSASGTTKVGGNRGGYKAGVR